MTVRSSPAFPQLHFYPPTLDSIIEQESNQVGHTHVPHGCTGGDEENEEVLFVESDVPDDQSKVDPGKEEYDSQNRTWKEIFWSKQGYRVSSIFLI